MFADTIGVILPNRSKSAQHKQLTGRKPGVDCAGNSLPAPVLRLAAANIPEPPETMGKVARAHWERLWQANWMLPAYDLAAVTRLCEMYEDRDTLRRSIAANGLTVWAKNSDFPHANPLVGHLGRLESEIRKMEIEFGLTPAARSRLGLTEIQRQSKLEDMMRRQREA